jgi:hypothetical protein
MFRRRGYRFITLDEALADEAIACQASSAGFSWIHRWSQTKGMKNRGEPRPAVLGHHRPSVR